jgi:hypothetical protein
MKLRWIKEMDNQHLSDFTDTFPEQNLLRGAFQISRSIFQSEVWFKDHLYLKAWVWMIGKANHQTIEKDGFVYYRGEFYTTYDKIREALKTHQHHRKIIPTLKKARVIIEWFEEKRMIEKTPVRESEAPPIFHPFPTQNDIFGTEKRAYVGLKIKIVNYDRYQNFDLYKGRPKGTHRGRRGADQGHDNKNERRMKKERNRRMMKKYSPNSDEFRLASLLLNAILKRNPKFKKPDLIEWAEQIEAMICLDKRTPEEVEQVIRWCQADDFWQNNILSASKLRIQFDQIWMKMKKKPKGVSHSGIDALDKKMQQAFGQARQVALVKQNADPGK